MSDAYDNIRAFINESKALNNAVELNANTLADLLEKKNLRHVSGHRLARIKRELHRFNAVTKEWSHP